MAFLHTPEYGEYKEYGRLTEDEASVCCAEAAFACLVLQGSGALVCCPCRLDYGVFFLVRYSSTSNPASGNASASSGRLFAFFAFFGLIFFSVFVFLYSAIQPTAVPENGDVIR